VQESPEGKERTLYYLSWTLIRAELNYSPIKRMCLALVFVVQNLRHYMQAYTAHVIFKADLIKYILSRQVPNGQLTKWAVI